MEPMGPRHVAHLFRPLLRELITLLRGLGPDEWDRPTVAGPWRVRDVAAHLLDGDLRKLAAGRDRQPLVPGHQIATDRDLASFIDGLNATGVAYAARLSPRVLIDLLEVSGSWVIDLLTALRPHAPAVFPVSWAGERASENWMDVGREFTERWHHQMQIRDAVSAPLLLDAGWTDPLLDFSVRALPHAYADLAAPSGTTVTLHVHGATEEPWSVVRNDHRWEIMRGKPSAPDATASIELDDAWRLFYNALSPDAAASRVGVTGDHLLVQPLLRARSVIV
ncbi:MAG TPA: maleylpyruvate isomerase N-terminal domain-containing protein [Vicinamibacterales bacterium]|nr:maleylpyruvate isomerase N-terminal domain-containing protein [Vicinamibacterales bacterium]